MHLYLLLLTNKMNNDCSISKGEKRCVIQVDIATPTSLLTLEHACPYTHTAPYLHGEQDFFPILSVWLSGQLYLRIVSIVRTWLRKCLEMRKSAVLDMNLDIEWFAYLMA
ncbi:hypothetical protein RRF57_006917 [Xylaria bambusicola]|uniref:Uncharacterized protein n=1 Tax=Xylaria bambusicola TaxID=326684 RepID=A0AAN7Z5W3_9PEZI